MDSTVPCRVCAHQIAATAKRCPRCGESYRPVTIEKTGKRWKAWMLIGIAVAICGAAAGPWNKDLGANLMLIGFSTSIGAKLMAWWDNG